MKNPQTKQRTDIATEVAFILRHLPDWDRVATSWLVDRDKLGQEIIRRDLPDTRQNRALILADIIHDTIKDKVTAPEPNPRHFAHWKALWLLYGEQRSPSEAAAALCVAPRTVNRYANRGFQLLAAELMKVLQ